MSNTSSDGSEAVKDGSVRAGRDPLARPTTTEGAHIQWSVAGFLIAIHLVACAAFFPALFSWSGLVVGLATMYLIGTLGINVCYHRLLTHRSFATPKWFERVLTVLAVCNAQGSSIHWVAAHRVHHQHSDDQPDPHTPFVSFMWAHFIWLVVRNSGIHSERSLDRYAADLRGDKFHRKLDDGYAWIYVWAFHALLITAAGFGYGYWQAGGVDAATAGMWMAGSWLVWGVALRMVMVYHITWAINSVTHVWGYKNYQTTDDSRNNWLFGFLGMGEGWHNNHHADQRSAAHGHRWWELDVTYLTIRFFQLFGLATKIVTPKRNKGTTHDIGNKRLDAAEATEETKPELEPAMAGAGAAKSE